MAKLKGEFALVRTKGHGENSWLLIKHRDRYASESPVTDKDRSVRTPTMPASAPKKPMPKDIPPMLATLVDKPFDEKGWSYEIKWDGYRALAYLKRKGQPPLPQ